MTATTRLATLVAVLLTVGLRAQDLRPELPLDVVIDAPETLTPRLPSAGWIPGDAGAFYEIVEAPDAESAAAVDRVGAADRRRERLFDAPALWAALRAAGAEVEDAAAKRLPPFRFVETDKLRIVAADAVWSWRIGDARAERKLGLVGSATAHAVAPGDRALAYVQEGDLFVRGADAATRRVTFDGRPEDIVYGGAAHRAEFGIHDGLWWDPKGERLALSREDLRPIARMPFADHGPVPPEPLHGRYPIAGSTHSKVTIGVFERDSARLVWLEQDPDEDRYWTNVTFTPDGRELWVALVDRAQSNLELCAFDAASGRKLRTLHRESDPEWIEPEHGPIFLPDGTGYLWFSSRSGHRHLWRHAMDGTLQWPETDGAFDVTGFLRFAPDGARCWVAAAGPDPRGQHVFEVRLGRPRPPMLIADDGPPKMLQVTGYGDGWHDCEVADDGALLDRWSGIYRPGMLLHRDTRGRLTAHAQAPDPRLQYRTPGQTFFTIDAEDGTKLHGHVLLPPGADPLLRHPVLLYVYGGPHAQLVQDRWQGGASLWLQHMASRGYVVVRLDGRGTPHRGIDFEQAVHRHLGEIEVIDQLAALEWVARNVPQADTTRVGVHGWSYGGYMTLRLMTLAPDRFVCGVAGAPVTDWRLYETGYTERYMDTPLENPDGYDAASVLPDAHRLKGRLLLVHGTDDRTVIWPHAMRFLRAAIDAGRPVDFMAYPMARHRLTGKDRAHFIRLMTRYFLEHLPPPDAVPSAAPASAPPTDARPEGDGGP